MELGTLPAVNPKSRPPAPDPLKLVRRNQEFTATPTNRGDLALLGCLGQLDRADAELGAASARLSGVEGT